MWNNHINTKKDTHIYEMAKNVDDIKESKFVDLSLKRKNIVNKRKKQKSS